MAFTIKTNNIVSVGLVLPLHPITIDPNAITDENNVALTDESDAPLTS